jgi:hypothetical protein
VSEFMGRAVWGRFLWSFFSRLEDGLQR